MLWLLSTFSAYAASSVNSRGYHGRYEAFFGIPARPITSAREHVGGCAVSLWDTGFDPQESIGGTSLPDPLLGRLI
ncbi:hypothetical protein T440DRAFT_470171 [Plenodomus tracheiphilus IPT5]|uniref:Peptidase S8/S53 domain-containing protein n=1 Tax=Plenodomus tracheiphilus IPT5 TaxID=1408161 RepID=A0A6A7AZ91_9PLEO|nr:hypothetical protein T440DRAFT_470171 [Plenodomus tracheiphilus IPT5]